MSDAPFTGLPPIPPVVPPQSGEPGEIVLQAVNLSKSFGNIRAVDGLSFSIRKGQVVGFIGANGAGKTTTMRILATLEMADTGRIEILGYEATNYPDFIRPKLGWMPDNYGAYSNVTVEDYLDFYARAYGLYGKTRRKRVQEIMEFTDLTAIKDRLMNKLSKGMGQRLCLGRALINDPALLLMDEPAAGLDPKARVEFKNLVRILASQGKTMLISSHILSELGEMCDTLLFIDKGRIVHHGSAEALLRSDTETVRLEINIVGSADSLIAWAKYQPGLVFVDQTNRGARFDYQTGDPVELSKLLARAIADGLQVHDFHRLERRLEDAFIDIIKGKEVVKERP
jgi:ABC-2 type transport system ATP-binding protein